MRERRQWTFRELASAGLLEYGDGYRTRKDQLGSSGFPILRVADVLDGQIAPSCSEFVRPEYRPAMRNKVSRQGDIVLTTKGTVGRVAMMPEGVLEYSYSPQVCYFRVDPEAPILAKYLYYWLRSDDFRRQAAGMKGQTDMADYLNLADIGSLRIAHPSKVDQCAIVEILGALDDKITLNGQILEASLNVADCYYDIANKSGHGASIATISQLKIDGHIQFGDGYRTKKAEHGRPGLPILRVAEIADGDIRPAFGDHVREEFRSAMGQKISRAGDVVLTTKGTVGRVALITADQPEFVYSPQVCYFRTIDNFLSSVYLFHWMRGLEFWRQAAGLKGQTDMADYLSLGDIKSLHVTLPSRAALDEFNRKCEPLHAQIAAVRSENRTLIELRDTLLPQFLSGKTRIKDTGSIVEETV